MTQHQCTRAACWTPLREVAGQVADEEGAAAAAALTGQGTAAMAAQEEDGGVAWSDAFAAVVA